jgi:hypothetical protein
VSKSTDIKRRRLAATEARVHFGQLGDDVADGRKIAEIERSDGYTVLVEPASDAASKNPSFDAEAWLGNLDSIQERIQSYLVDNPITETSTETIRKLRDRS